MLLKLNQLPPFPGESVQASPDDELRYAPMRDAPGELIPYVRLNEGASTPVLVIPGFVEGIPSKIGFAKALAERGYDVVLPDQNRRIVLKDARQDLTATQSLARHMLAVMKAEGLQRDQLDVVTHSYGSLVGDALHACARKRRLDCFEDAKLIMTAPAGLNPDETLKRLIGRTIGMVHSEGPLVAREIKSRGRVVRNGVGLAMANLARAARECNEVATGRVDYKRLLRSELGMVAVVSYANDCIFPPSSYETTMPDFLARGGVWAMPVSFEERAGTIQRSKQRATHNDEYFHPDRVADTVAQLLED